MTRPPASPSSLARLEEIEAELKLTFPAKYKVRSPIAVDVKRDYAEYHSVYSYEGSDVHQQAHAEDSWCGRYRRAAPMTMRPFVAW